MTKPIAEESIRQLFTGARTHHAWLDSSVSETLLHQVVDLMKWAPTSLNSSPVRILFVKSEEAKQKLYPALMGSNADQVKAAPVTAIIAYDEKFYDDLPTLFPAFDARSMFATNPALSQESALRNGSLQGAYFMLAARAIGLDVGPMSGFSNVAVDEAFFKGTSWKSNFLCNIGYGDHSTLYPRGPRLNFDQLAKIA